MRFRHSSFSVPHSAFAAALAALLYAVTLGGTYIFDDVGRIIEDPRVSDVSQWGRFLTESYNEGIDNLYRPITSYSYALQAVITGTDEGLAGAAWFHLVNILLFAVICAQIAVLIARIAEVAPGQGVQPVHLGLIAGLIFAAHPVHVEVVAGIVGRAELICAVGFLGALLVVTHPTRPMTGGRVAAVVAFMLLSIGGKEQGLVLPGVLLTWYAARRWAKQPTHLNGNGRLMIASVTLVLAGYLMWRESILPMAWPRYQLDPTIQTMRDTVGWDRWLMPVALLGRSLQLLVMPWRLVMEYGSDVVIPPQRLGDPYLWLGFATLLGWLAAFGHALWRRWTGGLLCLVGLALTYLPASNGPTLIGTIFGERLLFLPSVFFVGYVVLLAARLPMPRRVFLAVAVIVILLGSVRTVTYAARWNDRLDFYAYQTRINPRNMRTWMALTDEARRRGDLDLAAEASRRATELAPDYWGHWAQRAKVAMDRGELDEALRYAEKATDAKLFLPTSVLKTQIRAAIAERDRAAQ